MKRILFVVLLFVGLLSESTSFVATPPLPQAVIATHSASQMSWQNLDHIEVIVDTPNANKDVATITHDIKNYSLLLLQKTGLEFHGTVYVYLDLNQAEYRKDIAQCFGQSQAQLAFSETDGYQQNNQVFIPYYKYKYSFGSSELVNTITHELTHVLLYQNGIEQQIPIWVNEGFAWIMGNQGEQKVSRADEQVMENIISADIHSAVQSSIFQPLEVNQVMFTKNSPKYDVEYEDYLAMRNLVRKYGLFQIYAFIHDVQREGTDASFYNTYHMSLKHYENMFYYNELHSNLK